MIGEAGAHAETRAVDEIGVAARIGANGRIARRAGMHECLRGLRSGHGENCTSLQRDLFAFRESQLLFGLIEVTKVLLQVSQPSQSR